MKIKLFAAIITAFLLSGLSSAQGFVLRVDYDAALQTTYNLDGAPIEPADTILHVIGEYDRWLKIRRDDGDLWMPDWESYTFLSSARDYQLRLTYNTNLRVSHSLDADILETVPAGTILHVIGQSDRWLKINRDDSHAWMANWVAHTIIDSIDESTREYYPVDSVAWMANWVAHATIDSNGESTREYFLRVPYDTELRATKDLNAPIVKTAPRGTVLHVIGASDRWLNIIHEDRDLWMPDWLAHTIVAPTQDYLIRLKNRTHLRDHHSHSASIVETLPQGTVLHVIGIFDRWFTGSDRPPESQRQSSDSDTANLTRPRIEGSDDFTRLMEDALDMLMDKAPYWYRYVINAIENIRGVPTNVPHCSIAGVNPRSWGRRVHVNHCPDGHQHQYPIYEGRVFLRAGQLAHEACHLQYHYAGIQFATGEEGEVPCRKIGWAAGNAIDPRGDIIKSYAALPPTVELAK